MLHTPAPRAAVRRLTSRRVETAAQQPNPLGRRLFDDTLDLALAYS